MSETRMLELVQGALREGGIFDQVEAVGPVTHSGDVIKAPQA
jgi:hypothetical protein